MKFKLDTSYRSKIPSIAVKEGNAYFVNIETLEELVELAKSIEPDEEGGGAAYRWYSGTAGLIMWLDDKHPGGIPTIEIYDGYRE